MQLNHSNGLDMFFFFFFIIVLKSVWVLGSPLGTLGKQEHRPRKCHYRIDFLPLITIRSRNTE